VVTHIPPVATVRLPLIVPAADAVLNGLEAPLHSTAHRIYRTLHGIALATAQAKAQTLSVCQVVIHQPVELLALHLGISRVTFYKHLATLKRLGLVASRGHVSSYGGLARKDGTLFAVSFKPGHRARFRYDDLKHKWRDLAGDIASGTRTAWSVLQALQSKSSKDRVVSQAQLVAWAVNPGQIDKTPVTSDCKGGVQEYVYSLDLLADTHPRQRAETVNRYAQALAAGYSDSTNLNFWRWLLWRALDSECAGIPMLHRLQNALTRLQADVAEWQGLKKPGALLVARLRQCGIWDALTSPTTSQEGF
jgi:DNA-binding transcriptional ArsR family regulator